MCQFWAHRFSFLHSSMVIKYSIDPVAREIKMKYTGVFIYPSHRIAEMSLTKVYDVVLSGKH